MPSVLNSAQFKMFSKRSGKFGHSTPPLRKFYSVASETVPRLARMMMTTETVPMLVQMMMAIETGPMLVRMMMAIETIFQRQSE